MPRSISPQELQALIESEDLHAALDVRSRRDQNAGHILHSTPIPARELTARIAQLVPVRNIPVAIVGDDSDHGATAASELESLGYRDVRWLEGGFEAWRNDGFEVVSGTNTLGGDFGEKLLFEESVD